jgi:glycerate 2-kinase
MRSIVLVAPAAFKGSFRPREVADALAVGVRRVLPDALVLNCPIADGGDGLLDAVLEPGALRERVRVTGPLGSPVEAQLGWIDPQTAILESASACGLALLKPEERAPLRATSRGVGELIFEAVDRGADSVIVGLGGTATVDGGTGAARGLGWTFADAEGKPLPEGGGALTLLATMEGGWGLGGGGEGGAGGGRSRIIALTDVATPLVGPEGAAPIFAPQKGATPAQVALLGAGLQRLADLFARSGRPELAALPGGGAAGGLGAGLVYFAKADLARGAEWVFARVGFDAALAKADLVITGEGVFDRTSLVGKAAGEALRRAQAARKKVAVVAARAEGFAGVHVVAGDGRQLDATGIAGLGEQAAREAFGLPVA